MTLLLYNKIADKFIKSKPIPNENPRYVKEIINASEKRKETNELRQVL